MDANHNKFIIFVCRKFKKMRKEDLRIVFMGTPEFAVETLSKLVDQGYHVVAVVTQPDKPVGRHQDTLQASPVKRYAQAHGLPVLQPEKLKDPAFVSTLKTYRADLQVVVAFRMLPEVVWAMPRFGTFNVHAALLPQYRGAAPINWAIIHGERETGVTTFFLDHDIDTGRIILQKPFPIPEDADVEYVYEGLMRLGATAAIETIDKVIAGDGRVESVAQDDWAQKPGGALHPAPKIFKETCQIDWQWPAKRIYDFVRGLSPYPCAWTNLNVDGKASTLKIYKTAQTTGAYSGAAGQVVVEQSRLFVVCGTGCLEILELQLAGKKRMAARDFLNGMRQHDFSFIAQ